ncbi:LIM domain only protein 7 isoform X2 [Petromyzon marinus]|uniref:LIM domain only protein 7 isoform X2 n=1 Tax=Petromyzon marinus TaxID=7757 RepID=UPI003F714222
MARVAESGPAPSEAAWGEETRERSLRDVAGEARRWIQEVTGRELEGEDFRAALENGVALCDLVNHIKPGLVKRVNRQPTPIAGLDNVNQFLDACANLGLKPAQLFHAGDLQDTSERLTISETETDRRLKNVLITLYWLGRAAQTSRDYQGPALGLQAFDGVLSGSGAHGKAEEAGEGAGGWRGGRDSGYLESCDSERSASLSPPSHVRDDSLDSLDSLGSLGSAGSRPLSPDAPRDGGEGYQGSDAESEGAGRRRASGRDDMSLRRVSTAVEPKTPPAAFNQFLPGRHQASAPATGALVVSAHLPAPLRRKRGERNEVARRSWASSLALQGPDDTDSVGRSLSVTSDGGLYRPDDDDTAEEERPRRRTGKCVTFSDPETVTSAPERSGSGSGSESDGSERSGWYSVTRGVCGTAPVPSSPPPSPSPPPGPAGTVAAQRPPWFPTPALQPWTMGSAEENGEHEGARSPDIITRRDNPFLSGADGGSDGDEEEEEDDRRFPDVERDDLATRRALGVRGPAAASPRSFLPTPCTERDARRWDAVVRASRHGASRQQQQQQQRQRLSRSSPPLGPSPTWGPTPQPPDGALPSPKILTRRENAFLSPARDDDEGGGGGDDDEGEEERVPDVRRDDMTARRTAASLPVARPAMAFNRFLPNPAARQAQDHRHPTGAAGPRREGGAAVVVHRQRQRQQGHVEGPVEGLLLFAERIHVDTPEPAPEQSESTEVDPDGTKSLTNVAGEGATRSSILLHYEELQKIRGEGKEQEEQWQDDLARWKNRRRSTSSSLKRLSTASEAEGPATAAREIRTYAQMMHNREDRARDRENGYGDQLHGTDDVFSSPHDNVDSSVRSSSGRAPSSGLSDPPAALRPAARASPEPPVAPPRRIVAEKELPSPPAPPDSNDDDSDGDAAPPGPVGPPRAPLARGPEVPRPEEPAPPRSFANATAATPGVLAPEDASFEKPPHRPIRVSETKIVHESGSAPAAVFPSSAPGPVAPADDDGGRAAEPSPAASVGAGAAARWGPAAGPQPWGAGVAQRVVGVRPGVQGVRVLPSTGPRPFSAAPRSLQSLPSTYKAENLFKAGSSVDGPGVTGSLSHSDSRGDAQDRWGSSEELSDTESERAAQASVRPPTKAPPAEIEPLVQLAQTPHHAVFTAAPPPQAPVSTSLWDDGCMEKDPQGEAGSNGGSSLDFVSISRKNQMRRSQFFGLPVESAELPPPLQPVPLWSQTPPVPAPRARTIEPSPEDLRLAAMETERRRQEEERIRKREQEERKREEEERKREEEEEHRQKREQEERGWQGEEEHRQGEEEEDDDDEEERRQEEEARRQQQVNEEERRRQEEELRKRQLEQGRLRLEQEQEQRRQRAIEEARRRAAAAEEEESRKQEEEKKAAARKRREEEQKEEKKAEMEKERRRQEEQAAVTATAGARGSARAWTRVHTESDAGPQHKPVSVQRATGNMAQKLLEEANTQRLSALAASGARPGPGPAAAPPDPAVLDEERRQIVQQMKYPNPAARARGSLVFKEPALAREEARTASQAEKERQRILQELKKPAVVTSDASWIRNRGKRGAAVGGAAVPAPRHADDEWKRSSGVEFRAKRSSTLGGDRSWIRHSLAMGEMEHDRASAIASELSHVRRQCDDMGLRPTDMTDGPGSWNRSSPVSPEPAPDRPASGKKQCWGCQSSVGKGAAMFIESLNVYFHLECFKCGVCGGGLTTMGSGVDVRLRSGRLHCHECFTRADNGLQPQA